MLAIFAALILTTGLFSMRDSVEINCGTSILVPVIISNVLTLEKIKISALGILQPIFYSEDFFGFTAFFAVFFLAGLFLFTLGVDLDTTESVFEALFPVLLENSENGKGFSSLL
ncbi:MAG: hypothetical protein P8N40_06095 [Gammaproteobacteria bacterium]|nr:hypothetical protein [Gammaproteobacteria bacterium]